VAGMTGYLPQNNKFIENSQTPIAMKKNLKVLFCTLLIIAFSFSLDNQALGQDKVNISAGIGAPELINIGVRLQHDQIQIAINIDAGALFSLFTFLRTPISFKYQYHQ